jgi:YVTN family beta-propeller protein
VYAAESGDCVGVINASTSTLIADIPVGFWPTSLAVSPDGSTVYVTDAQSDTISVIDASTHTITATVPPGNPGPVYAFVTTIRGGSEATPGAQYTYQSVPTITGVSPDDGLVGGGGVSTITGTGLSGPATVMYGTKAGKILSQSPTEMRVSAPPGTAGTTVDITVSNTVGTSAISSVDEYHYFQLVHIPTPPIGHPILWIRAHAVLPR